MLMSGLPALTLAGALAAAGCSATASPRGAERVTPSPTAAVSFPADATVTRGAITNLRYRTPKQGYLLIATDTERTPTGELTRISYERHVNCHDDPLSKNASLYMCKLAWEVHRTLKPGAFVHDATLDSATLTDTVRGRAVRVTWTGYGEVRRQTNENGNLLFESRDAKATSVWGKDRYTDPKGTTAPSNLFHRVTARER